ncbi:ThiF family adenylyltransferase [Bacillus sp. DJP31]|uniref:ThiF family adenylyltransferase n=1 Tax=Bacillus sp. DJP31 TaxID=3409789 RepID=UPI003BB5E9C9
MSTPLIDHNDDLTRLKVEGYDISIVSNNVVVRGVPYVNKEKNILFGTLYCPLTLSADEVLPPSDHTARFMGEHPCDQFGTENGSFVNSFSEHNLTPEIIGNYYFSSKPQRGNYTNYYSKITKYIDLLSAPAKSLAPGVSAQNFNFQEYSDNSIFKYPDTNITRAEISHISDKLKGQKIAIVGLGGTGSFLLDFVSKTPVQQISLFDGDEMLNHNAFRMPGTMTVDQLKERPSKVSFFKKRYEVFRDGIIEHEVFIDESNLTLLDNHDFVFLAIDNSKAKKPIIEHLIASKMPFVDLGMGISVVGNSLRGTIRKTLITPENSSYLKRISIEDNGIDDLYSQNIQISELNAFNAILGIISWKKLYGFYSTEDTFYNSVFIVDEEEINNEA